MIRSHWEDEDDPWTLNSSSRFMEDPAAMKHSAAGYCPACDNDGPNANLKAANDPGAISTHTGAERPANIDPSS